MPDPPGQEEQPRHARDYEWWPWASVGRTIYARVSDRNEVLIGMMDTPQLAMEACDAHNERTRIDAKRAAK